MRETIRTKGGNILPRIIICDREKNYALRLMEYLQHRPLPYETAVFFSAEGMKRKLKGEKGALLVISESEYGAAASDTEFLRTLILNESGNYLGKGVRSISKYRSMDGIYRTIEELCMEGAEESGLVLPGRLRHGRNLHIIGIYTPVHRSLQTTVAVALGQLLGKSSPCLYMNFEGCSGLSVMLKRDFGGSVADLVYWNEFAREKVASHLMFMTQSVGSLHFLPPAACFAELRSIRAGQWLELFKTIEEVTEYEYLILDLTEQTDGLLEILRGCDEVITITGQDSPFSEAKMEQYRAILKEENCEDIYAKTRRWRLPVFRDIPDSLEDMTRGELAQYIRMNFAAGGLNAKAAI